MTQAHYLVRHVSRTPEDAAAAAALAASQHAALEAGLAAIVARTRYAHATDPEGTSLGQVLTELLASADPARAQAMVLADVNTVLSIIEGTSALDVESQRRALAGILGPHVADVSAITETLLFRPYHLSSCQLWLEPDGIVAQGTHITSWTNLAPSGATVTLPGPDDLPGCVLWLRADAGVTAAEQAFTLANASAFDNAAWTKTNVTVTANDTTDPDSGNNADRITESTGTDVARQVEHAISTLGLVVGETVTFSVSAKRPATDGVDFLWIDAGSSERVYFDLTTGKVATQEGGAIGTITALANGWYQCDATFVYSGLTAGFRIGLARTDGQRTYTVTSGARYLWLYDADITQSALRVSAWADQSGAGHTLVQATEAKQPMWRPADADFGAQASIDFDGADDFLADAAAALTTSTSFTIALVVRSHSDDTSERTIVESETGRIGVAWTGNTANQHYVRHNGGSASFASSVPEAHVTQDLIITFDAGTARLYEAGIDRGTVSYTSVDLDPGGALAVGSIFSGTANYFDGRVAEVIVYDHVLSDLERLQLRAYLSARYTPLGPQLVEDGPLAFAEHASTAATITSASPAPACHLHPWRRVRQ